MNFLPLKEIALSKFKRDLGVLGKSYKSGTLQVTTVLVGDIGGTNARFGVSRRDDDGQILIDSFVHHKGDGFSSLQRAIEAYLSEVEYRPEAASIAVAGHIEQGRVKLTNRDWFLSEADLESMPKIETGKKNSQAC